MTYLMPLTAGKKRWWYWPAALVMVELVWFGLLYPLVPRTFVGAALLGLLPIPVAAYTLGAMRVLSWVSGMEGPHWIRRLVAAGVTLSVGIAIFGLVLVTIMARRGDFGFGWFH
jgi:hypothetical protein